MDRPVVVGATVQTPFGKGQVIEARNAGRYLVQVKSRTLLLHASDLTSIREAKSRAGRDRTDTLRDAPAVTRTAVQYDLHGCTVDEALVRIDDGLNDALLRGLSAVRFIHGRSGGRLKRALHERLRELPSVRGFAVDEANAGVTIVKL